MNGNRWKGSPVEQRLFGRCVTGPAGCWVFTGAVSKNGYGVIQFDGRLYSAHRLAYLLTHGEVADGLVVMHSCDNKRCCNPDHLSVGTHSENVKDAYRRGLATPNKAAARLARGDVVEIKKRLRAGESQSVIAADYGVKQCTISNINTGKRWGEVH